MRTYLLLLLVILSFSAISDTPSTTRIPQISNTQVDVWQTIIYPSQQQTLPMHRHEHDRIVVALSSGTLKVTNNKGASHNLVLEKNKAYFLPKDPIDELHQDENITEHPITVMVIELK